MRKFWKIVIAFVLVLSITASGLYLVFRPQNADVMKQTSLKASTVAFGDLEDYLLDNPGKHYIYFCQTTSTDCEFVKNDLLVKLADDANVTLFEDIEPVDMSALSKDISSNAIRKAWGFSHYPAFVAYDSTNGEIIIGNVLEWDTDQPFTMDDIKTWMKNVGIWRAEYTN